MTSGIKLWNGKTLPTKLSDVAHLYPNIRTYLQFLDEYNDSDSDSDSDNNDEISERLEHCDSIPEHFTMGIRPDKNLLRSGALIPYDEKDVVTFWHGEHMISEEDHFAFRNKDDIDKELNDIDGTSTNNSDSVSTLFGPADGPFDDGKKYLVGRVFDSNQLMGEKEIWGESSRIYWQNPATSKSGKCVTIKDHFNFCLSLYILPCYYQDDKSNEYCIRKIYCLQNEYA